MKKKLLDMKVNELVWLSPIHILLRLRTQSGESIPETVPGQFVELKIENTNQTFLRRPISINFIDKANNELQMLIAVVGDGTRTLSQLNVGDTVNVMMPLGNGFPMRSSGKCLLVGGGVGVAPLLHLGAELKAAGCDVTYLLGGRNKDGVLMRDAYEANGRLLITTEDASLGEKGFVTDHSVWANEKFDVIYVCGPTPMMKAVAKAAAKTDTECYVSLENKMACGLGACLCCVTEDKDGHNRCVCTDGPVFNTKELPWQI